VRLGLIVEGHGEVAAVPILLRRLAVELGTPKLELPHPQRVPRSKLVKEPELKRAVELMARKAGPRAPLLILFDSDDDCPAALGPQLLAWAREQRSDRDIAVVLAHREFETWFLASAASLAGHRGLPIDLKTPTNLEQIRGAKEWLSDRMSNGYSPTIDQPAFAAAFDIGEARACRSFDKLIRDFKTLGPGA
jgi:hypothetical protein